MLIGIVEGNRALTELCVRLNVLCARCRESFGSCDPDASSVFAGLLILPLLLLSVGPGERPDLRLLQFLP